MLLDFTTMFEEIFKTSVFLKLKTNLKDLKDTT